LKNRLVLFILVIIASYKVDAQSWELKKNKEGVKVYTKSNPVSAFDLLKAECDIDVDVNQLLTLIFDVSKHTQWVYNAIQSVPIARLGTFDIIYYGETYAPWPVSNRDLIIHLTAKTDSTTGICTIYGISEPYRKPLVSNKVRVTRSKSVWTLIPIDSKTTHVMYTLDIDPGGSLPAWLVNFASTEGPYLSFKKMKSILLK